MARHLIPSDATIKAVRSGDPRKRLTGGDGLYLLLFVKGGAHGWRLDYTFEGQRKTLSLGTYPSTTLAIARRKDHAAREEVADGQDPSLERKAQRVAHIQAIEAEKRQLQGLPPVNSFEEVARERFAVRCGGWAKGYRDKVMGRLVADVFPFIGSAPVAGITPTQLLEILRRIEARGVIETAHQRAGELRADLSLCQRNRAQHDQPGVRSEGRAAQARVSAFPGDHRPQAL